VDEGGPQSPQRKKLYLLADEIGLTREERIEWASFAMRRDLTSWKQLDEDQVLRMLDQLEGFQLGCNLLLARPH
jgi:hypothetical protein